jgi:dihydroxy-acid dehydratase
MFGDVIRRVQWASKGASLQKRPRVAIVSSHAGMAVCYSHVPALAEIVSNEVALAGGLGIVIPTAAPCDALFFANGEGARLGPAFDRIVDDVEAAVRGADLDALVLLSSCDTTGPAHLVAAARINVPTVVLACGYQRPGAIDGRRIDLLEVYEAIGAALTKQIPIERLHDMADDCVTSPGVCPGFGTATTMHMAFEALGIALLGQSPVAGGSTRLQANARAAGRAIVDVARRDLRPRQLLTSDAIADAVKLVLTVGGAPSSLRFLQRLADELSLRRADGLPLDVRALAERHGEILPQICHVAPCGDVPVEAFEEAGGAAQALKRIAAELVLDRPVVSGTTLGAALDAIPTIESRVFIDAYRLVPGDPGLTVLHGNLAPGGGISRPGATASALRRFRGRALVLESSTQAFDALAAGRIVAGQVVVIRGGGIDDFACALHGAGLGDAVALVSDGGFSGLSRGLCVGYILPSARDDGPLNRVVDGDAIEIDLDARTVNVEFTA